MGAAVFAVHSNNLGTTKTLLELNFSLLIFWTIIEIHWPTVNVSVKTMCTGGSIHILSS